MYRETSREEADVRSGTLQNGRSECNGGIPKKPTSCSSLTNLGTLEAASGPRDWERGCSSRRKLICSGGNRPCDGRGPCAGRRERRPRREVGIHDHSRCRSGEPAIFSLSVRQRSGLKLHPRPHCQSTCPGLALSRAFRSVGWRKFSPHNPITPFPRCHPDRGGEGRGGRGQGRGRLNSPPINLSPRKRYRKAGPISRVGPQSELFIRAVGEFSRDGAVEKSSFAFHPHPCLSAPASSNASCLSSGMLLRRPETRLAAADDPPPPMTPRLVQVVSRAVWSSSVQQALTMPCVRGRR